MLPDCILGIIQSYLNEYVISTSFNLYGKIYASPKIDVSRAGHYKKLTIKQHKLQKNITRLSKMGYYKFWAIKKSDIELSRSHKLAAMWWLQEHPERIEWVLTVANNSDIL
jgi:hypothetical protein